MPTIEQIQTPSTSRRWSLRLAVTAGVLLLFALGAVPAGAGGAKDPQKIIFDLSATPSWTWTFHGLAAAPDAAEDVVMTKGGVTYVAGTIEGAAGADASLAKLVNGVPAWSTPKTYDSPHHSIDTTMKMALGPGGTVYTAGMSVGANGMFDILVVKWSSSGAVKWAKRYDGPSHGQDIPSAVVVDSAGNVTAGGYSMGATGVDWVVVSWSASGARRWTSRYSSSSPHEMLPHGHGGGQRPAAYQFRDLRGPPANGRDDREVLAVGHRAVEEDLRGAGGSRRLGLGGRRPSRRGRVRVRQHQLCPGPALMGWS